MMNRVHLRKIDLNLLVVLDALLRERSVTRAAKTLHLSQSAASHALGRLREVTGDALLVRDARGMVPTPRAQALQEPLGRILRDVESALGPQRFDPSRSAQTFTIGTTDYVECLVCPLLIERIRKAAPLARVQIKAMKASRLALDADIGRSDVVVSFAPASNPGWHCRTVMTETYSCLTRAEGHAARRLSLKQYLAAEHIVVSTDGNFSSVWESALLDRGHRRNVVMTTPHYLAAAEMVARSDLFLTIQSRLARVLAGYLPVVVRSLPFEIEPIDLTMHWSDRVHSDRAQRWLRELIAATCKETRRLVTPPSPRRQS